MKIVRLLATWLIVIAVGYAAWRFLYPLFLADGEETDIQTTTVSRGDLRKVVPADGVLVPSVMVEVKSKASGVVELTAAEPGDIVVAGDILIELDKEVILASLRQAEADVAAAEAQLELTKRSLSPQQRASRESSIRNAQIAFDAAELSYGRIAEMYGRGFATQQEMDDAQRNLDSTRESLEQANKQMELDLLGAEEEQIAMAQASLLRQQAALDNVKEDLANTTIRAPINGTILTRPVELGTAVASGTSGSTGGTVVATIGDLSTMFVEAMIDETDLGKVKVDTGCRVTFDAFTGWRWDGTVKKIYPQGISAQGGTQFPVDIEIDVASGLLDAGEFSGSGKGMAGMMARGGGGGMPSGMGGRGGGGRPSGGGSPHGMTPPGGEATDEEAKAEDRPKERKKPDVPQLYSQMTASIEIVLEDHPDVLILDARYVKYDSGKPYIEVLPDPEDQDTRERRDLVLGFSDGLRYEVVSGVDEGETVILERPISTNGGRR